MRRTRSSNRPLVVITNWRDRRHPEAGGAEEVCEQLAGRFAQSGMQVVLLTASVPGAPNKEEMDGFSIVRRGGRFSVYPWALLWLLARRRKIAGVIDSQNGIPFFTPLVTRRRTPVVMLLHHVHQDQFDLYFSPIMSRIGKWLEKTGSRLVYQKRSIVLVSPSTRNAARLRLGLQGDMVVVPPGSEPVACSQAGIAGRSGTATIVCVGRLAPHKRTAVIVEAMPELLSEFPGLTLHLVGDGPERSALEDLTGRLGLGNSVVLHGWLASSERDHLLRTAWMSVNASEAEGWALSVIEANAFGVPVLAYPRPGLKDSIRDGETGWLIDEDMSPAKGIASALRELSDERTAEAMATRARQWSSQFTWEEMARRVLAVLHAEEDRLAHLPDKRRIISDVATVVRIPVDLLPGGVIPKFRSTDNCMISDDDLVVLLRGHDTDSTRMVLERVGLYQSAISDPRVVISVARPVDLVSPAVSASHVIPPLSTESREDALAG